MKNLVALLFIALAMSSCSNREKEEAAKQAAIVAVKDSIRLDSFKRADAENKAKIVEAEKQKTVLAQQQAEEKRLMMLAEERSAANAPAVTSRSTTTTSTTKKGWSSAAKGTAIGAGAGALGGALIDKKKGRGAIIGGVVGAGTGYVIGRGKDKKSGIAH